MLEIRDGIAVLVIDNGGGNAERSSPTGQLAQWIVAAQQDDAVRGMVVVGDLDMLSKGELGSDAEEPVDAPWDSLRDLIGLIEASSKPVVAGLSGVALGGCLEFALACHGRVSLDSTVVGFPDITLGLIPGCGGIQRLARLVGVEMTLDMTLGGQVQGVRRPGLAGLVDGVVAGDLYGAAVHLAQRIAASGQPLPRVRDLPIDGASAQVAVEARRAQLGARQKLQPVYGAVLQAVAAVGLQFDEALQRERELCQMLVRSSAAHALRYQLDAEEAAISQSDATGGMPRSVQRVAVIGAGTMGSGIAIAALSAGLNVLLLEQDETALARGRERISQFFAERVSTGKLKAAIAAEHECRLSVSIDWARLGEVDLVVEAVFEDLEVKQQVFRQIDAHARPGAILATNTSYLDVDAIASVTSRPQDVLGLHFFSPANVMRLLEVVRGNRTAPEVLATGMEFGLSLKKLPVICGNAFGFIGNRIYNAYRRQCEFMLEDGAWPEDIDGALTAMGFAMGPFAVADLSGLDIAWRMRKAQAATRDPGERYVDILDRLCEAGRLGRKAGAGYYAYGNGKATRISDDTVRSIIEAASLRRGITRRTLTPTEIQRRALLAMVNEVALLLAEGVAGRASDVDVVLVQGYGFPRWHGGPVFWARQQDRDQLELELRRLAQESGPGFVVADLTPVLRSR